MKRNFTIQNVENMTLAQCQSIAANQYRSANNEQDYCPFAIEERIVDLKVKQAQKMLKLEQATHVVEFDNQLAALMDVTIPGKFLLSLIDAALKNFARMTKVESEITRYEGSAIYELDGRDISFSFNFLVYADDSDVYASDINIVMTDGDVDLPSEYIPKNIMAEIEEMIQDHVDEDYDYYYNEYQMERADRLYDMWKDSQLEG